MFSPNADCTRAEIVTLKKIMYNKLRKLKRA